METKDLEHWMSNQVLNKVQTAAALEIGRPTLDRYLLGRAPIPKTIGFACAAIAMGLPEYRKPSWE